MTGQDYDSFEDFMEAFKQGAGPLDPASVLGKPGSII
jgi:hypothetical protein